MSFLIPSTRKGCSGLRPPASSDLGLRANAAALVTLRALSPADVRRPLDRLWAATILARPRAARREMRGGIAGPTLEFLTKLEHVGREQSFATGERLG